MRHAKIFLKTGTTKTYKSSFYEIIREPNAQIYVKTANDILI